MNKAVIIAGPTASGKTDLAVKICLEFGGEVISADSMQIYKGMDIATAKPTKEEMQGVPHHLMDFLPPSSPFSVSRFKKLADEALSDICARGKLPVIAGGTGLYIDSLVNNTCFGEFEGSRELREKLNERAQNEGGEALLKELEKIDPCCAARLHANDTRRIIRALEVYHCTGKTLTQHEKESHPQKSQYDFLLIGLFFEDRQELYRRINLRVDKMFAAGLEQEALSALKNQDSPTAFQAIGYKELKPYFDGEITLEQASEALKQSTRNYAKRQMTWFRRYESMIKIYVDRGETEKVPEIVRNFLK